VLEFGEIGEVFMNKQEAAKFLGVSVRALERYVQQGRISVKYEKGKTRRTANFEQAELETFREELTQSFIKPAFESRQISPDYQSRQIATDQQQETGIIVQTPGEIGEIDEFSTVNKLALIIEGLLSQNDNQVKVSVADKLLLTIPEAQALTGLSREFLKNSISSGNLKAKFIGKGWRIKRSDLNQYVDEMF
jgi:excisionase family DNA binding protein